MTAKTRIHLIRHGEVAGAGIPRYNGQADVPLSERGVNQYHGLKERLAGERIAACYSSDLSRCTAGAAIICGELSLTPAVDRNLRELDIGVWEGMTWDEIRARYPEEWQVRLADLVSYRVPGGENLLDVHARVMPVIRRIVERHRGEEVLVVGHGGVNRIVLLDAIGAPLSSLFAIEQNYACRNIIDYYADGKSVVQLMNG